jgi:hypothetical protein
VKRWAALVVIGGACGAAAAQQAWREPAAVLGIPLGAPFAEAGFEDCSGVPATPPCVDADKSTDRLKTLVRLPDLGLVAGYRLQVLLHEGLVSAIVLTARHGDYERLRAVLVERYGEPTLRKTERVQSRMGAVFPSEQLLWVGKRVRIMAREHHDTLDQSAVMFSDVATSGRVRDARRGAASESTRDAASRL